MFTICVFNNYVNCGWAAVGFKVQPYVGRDWERRLFANGITKGGVTTYSLPIFPSGGVLEARVSGGQMQYGHLCSIGNPHVTVTLREVSFDILIDQEFWASKPGQIFDELQDNFNGDSLTTLIARAELLTRTTGTITTMTGSLNLPDKTVLLIEIRARDAYVCFNGSGVESSGNGDVHIRVVRRLQ